MTAHGASVKNMMSLMASRIDAIAQMIATGEIDAFLNAILDAKRIYVMGAGRSGLVAKSFAMRLMHMGLTSYVVGETITPAIGEGDLIVAFSGSGNTKTIGDIAETAKSLGVKVALISSNPDSRIGKIADYIIKIETQRDPVTCDAHEYEIRQMLGEHRSFAPLGTIFETTSLIFGDAVISTLMDMTKTEESDLKRRHTNIE
ncbi:MAG TPA: 6-phospho-3-hexuloisomerase [Methanocorpusculum sp.]|nr:6-phospho-3-hexuloisomerase [Methanocorpusculum sp.]HJK58847.1 6-phospho-3-hexuloisomerase [Methanocorpusculum sp.]HJK64172.1 6-phospho-3-hexuloisomerase [Methanocorpusculum sp.]HJK70027.1 6-phospho-3-hexuloisomerase [Methanocorpusculum sp.]HJK82882.1 6-phospho-3-hexuloisomerase [Methanocorpusculum sp.]